MYTNTPPELGPMEPHYLVAAFRWVESAGAGASTTATAGCWHAKLVPYTEPPAGYFIAWQCSTVVEATAGRPTPHMTVKPLCEMFEGCPHKPPQLGYPPSTTESEYRPMFAPDGGNSLQPEHLWSGAEVRALVGPARMRDL